MTSKENGVEGPQVGDTWHSNVTGTDYVLAKRLPGGWAKVGGGNSMAMADEHIAQPGRMTLVSRAAPSPPVQGKPGPAVGGIWRGIDKDEGMRPWFGKEVRIASVSGRVRYDYVEPLGDGFSRTPECFVEVFEFVRGPTTVAPDPVAVPGVPEKPRVGIEGRNDPYLAHRVNLRLKCIEMDKPDEFGIASKALPPARYVFIPKVTDEDLLEDVRERGWRS